MNTYVLRVTHLDQRDIAKVSLFKICLGDEGHFHLSKKKLHIRLTPRQENHLNLTIQWQSAENAD